MTHFGFNLLQERAKNFWEAQGSSWRSLSSSLPIPLSSPSAAATHSSGFIQDVAPFDDDCRSTPSNRVVAKGAASQEITCCSVCHWGPDKLHGADCNEHQLSHCSASGVPAQQSLSFITFSTRLSFPLRNLLACWNQRTAAPQFETCLTANSIMNWIVSMAMSRRIKEISPAAQNKEFFEVSSLLFLIGPLVAEGSQQGCFYRV